MADSISIPAFCAEYEQRLLNGLETPKDLSVKMTKENWLTEDVSYTHRTLPTIYTV